MDKLELDELEFYHSIWFTVLVIILLGVFIFPNQEFESLDLKIIKDNPIINNSTTNLICFFLIATIGVSHGSLDNHKGRKLLKFYSLENSIIFYLSYILIALFIIILWKVLPTTTLLIFLIIAAYHFGKEDSLEKVRKSNFYHFDLTEVNSNQNLFDYSLFLSKRLDCVDYVKLYSTRVVILHPQLKWQIS